MFHLLPVQIIPIFITQRNITNKCEGVKYMKEKSNLQEILLTKLMRERKSVTLFLMNGFQLHGQVSGFDNFIVILASEGKQQAIYKHAISTIMPEQPVAMEQN